MDVSITNTLIAASAGLIAGIVGSLVAPWVNWHIENKRQKRKDHVELIKQAREALSDKQLGQVQFRQSALYSRLKPHLAEETVAMMESNELNSAQKAAVFFKTGSHNPSFHCMVLDDVTSLERKWDLI